MIHAQMLAPLALFLAPLQAPPTPLDAAQLDRARDHYLRVGAELASRDVSELDAERRSARARLLAALAEYRERGDFGRRAGGAPERVPLFVDGGGRRCAVANLLHETGEDELVEAVRSLDNRAWVVDLAHEPAFLGWLDAHGITLWEAARIQLPTGGSPPDNGGPASAKPATPLVGTAPVSTAPGTPSGSGAGAGPSSGSARAGVPRGSGAAGSTQPSSPLGEFANGWWLWWEFNKLSFLRPNTLDARSFPLSGDSPGDALESRLRQLRKVLEPRLVANTRHRDSAVRAAAVVALGRTAGARAVPHLVERLGDGSQLVRHRALLALGATGAPEARALLSMVAREGTHRAGVSISPLARPLAVVALGLGRRAGFGASVDELVLEVLAARTRSDRSALGVAASIYHTLAPGAGLEPALAALAFDKDEPTDVRSRALESLSSSTDPAVLSRLQDVLHGPRLEARRSAALALGAFQHPLVAPALMTGFETEAEPFARGFLLVSLGSQGGAEAREFLTGVLAEGKHVTRPWAALALGILAHQDAGSGGPVAEALRAQLVKEKNRDTRAAIWLAQGLAGDRESVPALAEALASGADPRHRMYAASALALVGDDAARGVLLERAAREDSQLVRAAIAQGLGVIGRREDVPALYRTMREVSDPALRGLAITALAFHGSESAFTALRELAESTSTPSAALANAIDALGVMTSAPAPLALAEVSSASNFTLFSDWVAGLFQATL